MNLVSFKHFQNLFCLFSSCLNELPCKLKYFRPRESCHSVLPHSSSDKDKELAVLCNFLVSVCTLKNSAPFKGDCRKICLVCLYLKRCTSREKGLKGHVALGQILQFTSGVLKQAGKIRSTVFKTSICCR